MRRLPSGCKSAGGRLAIAMERCRHSIVEVFNSHGYRLFWPSGLQLLEGSWDILPLEMREKLIVLNSHAGEPCCLRADITLAAVNYLSTHYSPQERPLRICYSDRVYRKPNKEGEELESFQIGAELLGWEGQGADVEIMVLLLTSLDRIGLKDCKIVLSDARIISDIMKDLPKDLSNTLEESLKSGSYRKYETILKNNDVGPKEDLLKKLPHMKGSVKILKEVSQVIGEESTSSLRYIYDILMSLDMADRITFDLGAIRELNYYNGPLFEVYSPRTGRSLGGGGRYDGLLSKYGLQGQAIGFGLDLEELARLSSFQNPEPIVAVWGGKASPKEVLTTCSKIQAEGMTTEIFWGEDMKKVKDKAKAKGYSKWIDPSKGVMEDLEESTCSQ